MKVIVVYASAGAGHAKAGEAIYNYLKQHRLDLKIEIVDILEKSNPFFRTSYYLGYAFLVNHAPFLWRFGFWITQYRPLRQAARSIAKLLNRLNTRQFATYLRGENPDWIISTHFLPSEICAFLKSQLFITSRLITVITDFGVHPFWLSVGIDKYIVASERTRQILIEEGVSPECVEVCGIPIDPKFLKKFNCEELRAKLGLDKDAFTVLVVTGSFGSGPLEQIAEALHGQAQIIVVCARNQRLFERLKHKNYPAIKVFGFVNNIQELMAVSDVIVTKPGGSSISEILAMELFPIFTAAIPGQEEENLKALARHGIGVQAHDVGAVKKIVLDLKSHPEKLSAVKEAIRTLKKPAALEGICDVIR